MDGKITKVTMVKVKYRSELNGRQRQSPLWYDMANHPKVGPFVKVIAYRRPTDHYDERVAPIDEQICALLKQRKDISNHNPGYPPFEIISRWAATHGLYEDFLKSLFGHLRNEEHYRPGVEPQTFIRHLPVLKSVEVDAKIYTVTFIRQYANASVVYLDVDSEPTSVDPQQPPRHRAFELSIAEGYDCRPFGSHGASSHYTHQFTVVPPLPEDTSRLQLLFTEYTTMFGDPTGLEVVIDLNVPR